MLLVFKFFVFALERSMYGMMVVMHLSFNKIRVLEKVNIICQCRSCSGILKNNSEFQEID